jgi:serine/threonine protein kinase
MDVKNLFEKTEILAILYQLVQGIEFLHNNKIIHRNLKPSNILFNSYGILKISEHGFYQKLETWKDTFAKEKILCSTK